MLVEADEWEREATSILSSLIKRKGIRYKELSVMLGAIGVDESERAIASKLSRGKFSFAFFLQCMHVLNIGQVDVDQLVERKGQRKP